MRLRIGLPLLCILLGAPSVFGQELGKLIPRVSQLWEYRKQSNRADALPLVDPQTLNIFLEANETPIFSFKITGLEFTDDPNHVDMLVKVRSLIPRVGETDRMVREAWIWKDGQWFMHAAPPPGMFDSNTANRPAAPFVLQFKLTDTLIDVGSHTQGDVVEGKIGFQANREDIALIRPLQGLRGLSISSPVWTSASGGYLPYQWTTTLVSQNVDQNVGLEAIAKSDDRASAEVRFRARIVGKVGFKQVPEIVDPATAGQVELQIQNLTAKTLKILGVSSYNPAYIVDDNIQESIEPGKSGRLLIRYTGQQRPSGASLGLALSESLTPSGILAVPLNVKIPDEKRNTYTPDEIKKLVPPPPTLGLPTLPK